MARRMRISRASRVQLSLMVSQANVMLSYPVPEAEELLKTKLDTAKKSLATCEEDMEFLREQITVCSSGNSC